MTTKHHRKVYKLSSDLIEWRGDNELTLKVHYTFIDEGGELCDDTIYMKVNYCPGCGKKASIIKDYSKPYLLEK